MEKALERCVCCEKKHGHYEYYVEHDKKKRYRKIAPDMKVERRDFTDLLSVAICEPCYYKLPDYNLSPRELRIAIRMKRAANEAFNVL